MNIGIDIDGVLVDFGKFVRENGAPYFSKKYGLSIVNPKAYHAKDMFGCTSRQDKLFWIKFFPKYWLKEPCMEGSSAVIDKLTDRGDSIHLITSRVFTAGRSPINAYLRHLVRRWLKKNDIHYDSIVFCSKHETPSEKLKACLDNDIDIMIDDDKDNIMTIKNSISALLFDSPWNSDLFDKSVIRVKSWPEIYNTVLALEDGISV